MNAAATLILIFEQLGAGTPAPAEVLGPQLVMRLNFQHAVVLGANFHEQVKLMRLNFPHARTDSINFIKQ